MPQYLSPDIYVEEISMGQRPIEAVGTSLTAFVGTAPSANAFVNEPRAINNWSQFLKEFVGEATASTDLSQAVFGFFQNGGSRCFVVNVGKGKPVSGGGKRTGLDVLESLDDVAIVAAPGYTDAASYDAVLSHCEKLKDRVAILDAPKDVGSIEQLVQVATATSPGHGGGGAGAAAGGGTPSPGLRPRNSDAGFGAVYFPWITVRDPLSPTGATVDVPPSGHIAGIYARTDATRGVYKAPANESVRGALDVTYRLTREEQGVLNPAGVNCIRWFPTEGIKVWGSRTLALSASNWRHVPVRRLFNMIEESIARGTRWVVFEPNDRPLWKDIRRDVSAFLRTQWRDGALMGRTAEEAFFVQCDEETNPPESIAEGRVVTVVGIAPVQPAEFIIFRIGQQAGGVEIEA
jgi:hypothetical protein